MLTKLIKPELDKIRLKYQLELILMHGSQVSGKTHPKSDLDLAVVRQNSHQTLDLLKLIRDLTEVFNADNIDITDLTHANPLLLKTVTDKAKLLSGSKAALNTLQKKAFHRYSDYLPYFTKERQNVLRFLKTI